MSIVEKQKISNQFQCIKQISMGILPGSNIELSANSKYKSADDLARIIHSYAKPYNPYLNRSLLGRAKLYVDDSAKLVNLPGAESGRTPVYFPKDLPIVLKESGFPRNQERLQEMINARKLCDQNGYSNLVIPKASTHKNFIIETRLPISNHNTKKQIGLYLENRACFTQAVKEFAGFLCQSNLFDITGGRDNYACLSKEPTGRYDNVPLYLENGQGKIGLIDLEMFSLGAYKSSEEYYDTCTKLIRLFPCHFNEILEVAKSFDPDIVKYRSRLEEVRDNTLQYFKLIYEDHQNFVVEKRLDLQEPTSFARISPIVLEQLKDAIRKCLLEKNKEKYGFLEGVLGHEPEKILASFNEMAFPKIIEAVYQFIDTNLKFNLEKMIERENSIYSMPEFLFIRSLIMHYYGPQIRPLRESMESSLAMFHENYKENVKNALIDCIFKELVDRKIIAYYKPDFGLSGTSICIFC